VETAAAGEGNIGRAMIPPASQTCSSAASRSTTRTTAAAPPVHLPALRSARHRRVRPSVPE
jgi:hypothetical protein